MPWFKVDDQLHTHPKWLAASPAAKALWVTAGSWCASHLTDGKVPRHALPTLGGRPRDAAVLVAAGLWREIPEGWEFHDWLEMQPSAHEVRENRAALVAARSAAGKKGAAARWQTDGKPMANPPEADASEPSDKAMAPTRPDPTGDVTPPTPRKRRSRTRTPVEPPNPSSQIPRVEDVVADQPPFDPVAGKAQLALVRAALPSAKPAAGAVSGPVHVEAPRTNGVVS